MRGDSNRAGRLHSEEKTWRAEEEGVKKKKKEAWTAHPTREKREKGEKGGNEMGSQQCGSQVYTVMVHHFVSTCRGLSVPAGECREVRKKGKREREKKDDVA